MKVSVFLDSIENTEKEEKLIAKLAEVKKDLVKIPKIPIIGKLIGALIALGDAESIEGYKQTQHFEYIKDWNINNVDFDKMNISIQPGIPHYIKLVKVLSIVIICLFIIHLWKNRKNDK